MTKTSSEQVITPETRRATLKKYDYIDAIRGIAIMFVVMVHCTGLVTPSSILLQQITTQGARGVQLFYIASALTLFLSMDFRQKTHEVYPHINFFIRRFFRIAPAFYLAMIAYSLHYGMQATYWAPNGIKWWFFPLTALFINGWNPETITSLVPGGWSIAVEMTFYLFVPFLFKFINNVRASILAVILSLIISKVMAVLAIQYFLPIYPSDQAYLVHAFTYLWFFGQLPVFMLGILVFYIIRQYPSKDKKLGWTLLAGFIFLFLVFLDTRTYNDLLPQHFLYGLAFFVLILSLHFYENPILVNRFTILVGKLSFSIYLVHTLVMILIKTNTKISYVGMSFYGYEISRDIVIFIAFFITLFVSILVSLVTHPLIEVPGMKFGKYLIKKLEQYHLKFQ